MAPWGSQGETSTANAELVEVNIAEIRDAGGLLNRRS